MAKQSQIKANARYDAANTRRMSLKFNLKTDADILKRLNEVKSKQGYIKNLIREDIKDIKTNRQTDAHHPEEVTKASPF